MHPHSSVQPNAWAALRLPSGSVKVLPITPNTTISLGKYGSFPSNLIIERPYNLTYELLDREPGQKDSNLRIVPASELHADTIAEENAASKAKDADDTVIIGGDGVEYELVGEDGEVIMRSNRETIDDSARQTLTMDEIETLKREGTGAGKDLIAKLMLSHTAIDQKTAFSLAKYKLSKTKKYLKRFTILPLDIPMLTHWVMTEKDAGKVLEMRSEMLSLVGSWANVHFVEELPEMESGRWLVIDETCGLLVAAVAERMGLLYPPSKDPEDDGQTTRHKEDPPAATSNTITLIHNNAQPNLSLLKSFLYDPTTATPPCPSHPLHTHLNSLSWLQLLEPSKDVTYSTAIPPLSPTSLNDLKPAKRGTYYRKLRRWTRTTQTIDTARQGNFDGLVIASAMDPSSILRHTIPLLRGGANIAIYSPYIEPLVTLSDYYSTSRRTAFLQAPPPDFEALATSEERDRWQGNEDFPLNPLLVLNATVQSAKVREWQVLPGRTHPVMTGRGGAQGYLWTGVRVVPAVGRVEARGKFSRKRKVPNESNDKDKGSASKDVEEGVEPSVKRERVDEEKRVEEGENQGSILLKEDTVETLDSDVQMLES
ncbi:Uncharacterized protein BP5553_08321 [Venustampulla echinocandica]|uniref:tRNA (adenine(58)-N(1))-methyltransferase non-catalytic subunit TRM6 n=1 Tax=Venustampulla echinocandica TaxID=2656787 RepID=A0A370TGE0_9HELO|nr:Uncharacterized protein BP5553_08321 [Venustampulla echinocandica]RDL33953.1 Uncharacterized protein BP5553_08321 [Venustampulla echinocandica]